MNRTKFRSIRNVEVAQEPYVFSRSFLDCYAPSGVFRQPNGTLIFFEDELKQKFESLGLTVCWDWKELEVTDGSISKEQIALGIKNLQDFSFNEWRYQRYHDTFNYLEQVFLTEGDTEVIETFNTTIKNKWQDQFIRYQNGKLPKDERPKGW